MGGKGREQEEPRTLGSLEDENDLWHFLKVAKSDWSRHDVARVIAKLKAIDVSDVGELLKRVNRNTINDELESCGWGRFSRETIESIRKRGPFVRSLQAVHEPSVRQIGAFAPVPALFSTRRIVLSGAYRQGQPGRPDGKVEGPVAATGALDFSPSSQRRNEKGIQEHLDRAQVRASPQRRVLPGTVNWAVLEDDSIANTARSTARSNRSSRASILRLRYREDRGRPQPAVFGSQSVPTLPDIHAATAAEGFPAVHYAQDGSASSSSEGIAKGNKEGSGSNAEEAWLPSVRRQSLSRSTTSATAHQGMIKSNTIADFNDISLEELERMQQAGSMMRTQPLEARWLSSHRKGPLQQGEEMLEEQDALNARARLVRELDSTARSHLARNIKARLKEEEQFSSDNAKFINIEHRCTNIRKNLSAMVNARRELSGLRGRLLQPEEEEKEHFLKGCEVLQKLKLTAREEVGSRDTLRQTSGHGSRGSREHSRQSGMGSRDHWRQPSKRGPTLVTPGSPNGSRKRKSRHGSPLAGAGGH